MYKPITIQVNTFNGGISDDARKPTTTEFQLTKHFDIFSQPNRLIPYRSLESDTNDGSTSTGMKQYLVKDFVYASTSAKLYGLGQTGAGLTKIVYKADAVSGNWTLPSSSEGNGAVQNGCFFEYKDYLWGFQGTNQIFKWGLLSGTPSITNSAATVASTITSVANGIIHAQTGYAYMFYNNVIVRIQPDLTITDLARIVPDNMKITSVTNLNSYIAIGCSPKSSFSGTSKVFLWNGSSDLFAETIDFGEGDLRVIDVVDGVLIGITDRYLNNTTGAGRGSMIIQGYSGGAPQVLKEIFTQALTGKTIPTSKVIKNNRLFWSAKLMTNNAGTEYNEGLWSFGRKNSGYPFALTLDVVCQETDTDGIQAFGSAANYFFITHSGDGSISKTDDSATYSYTSVLETQIYNFGDVCLTKQLQQLSLYTTPIPSGGSVTIKYKVDSDTSFTTIGTSSTANSLSKDLYANETAGTDFKTFKELTLRFESTGGAEITGYKIIALPLTGSNG